MKCPMCNVFNTINIMPQNKLSELMKEYGDRPLNEIMDELMKQPPIEKSGNDDTRLSDMMKYYHHPSHVEAAGKEGECEHDWEFIESSQIQYCTKCNAEVRHGDIKHNSPSPGKAEEGKKKNPRLEERRKSISQEAKDKVERIAAEKMVLDIFYLGMDAMTSGGKSFDQCMNEGVIKEVIDIIADYSAQRSIKWPTTKEIQETFGPQNFMIAESVIVWLRKVINGPSPSCGKE